jgi:DNA-binding response OmpR family regulator
LIALTGWGAAEDRGRSQEAGFDNQLVKPTHLDDIEALRAPLRRPILHAESIVS